MIFFRTILLEDIKYIDWKIDAITSANAAPIIPIDSDNKNIPIICVDTKIADPIKTNLLFSIPKNLEL